MAEAGGVIAIVTGVSALSFGIMSGIVILSERVLRLRHRIFKNRADNQKELLAELKVAVEDLLNDVSSNRKRYQSMNLEDVD